MRANLRLGRLPMGVLVLLALGAAAGFGTAGAAQAKLVAHGSVQQVYATGLAPSRSVTLHQSPRRRSCSVAGRTHSVAWCSGWCPGPGIPGAPGPARGPGRSTVMSSRAGPAEHQDLRPAHPHQRLRLPDHARRDQAGDRRAPAQRAGPLPDAGRIRGLRLRRPGRRRERDQPDRRPCSASPSSTSTCVAPVARAGRSTTSSGSSPRRLRRDRDRRPPAVGAASQGGHAGHLLRRHQPAVRGLHRPTGPGGDRAAVGARQLGHHAVSGRHPQHRVCRGLDRGPPARRPAGLHARAGSRGR